MARKNRKLTNATLILLLVAGVPACKAKNNRPAWWLLFNSPGELGSTPCIGGNMVSELSGGKILVGGAFTDVTSSQAPFDVQAWGLEGGIADGAGPCVSCATSCTSAGISCANSGGGCSWWGCWQYDQQPPGQYVPDLIESSRTRTWNGTNRPQLPFITYEEEQAASGSAEGTPQVAALNDTAFLARYFADWRFLLNRIGNHVVLLQIEPGLWGFVQEVNENPHSVPAKVAVANPTDCATYENSASGFAACMIHMARIYAPNAKIGLHVSPRGTGIDVLSNSNPGLDIVAEAKKTAVFMTLLGAKDGDFLVTDIASSDAAYSQSIGQNTWWDSTNQSLPGFHQAFSWTREISENTKLPMIYWQIPVGNMDLANGPDHWKDNRLDYFFDHMDEVASAHVLGLFFGAGATGMTTPETDGGHFISRVQTYRETGGQRYCP